MKRAIFTVVLFLLSGAVLADNFSAIAPTHYNNGDPIPVSDTLSYKVYCGNMQSAYPFVFDAPNLDVGTQIDITACVQNTGGTYYFVATASSTVFSTESPFSVEISRTYTQGELDKTPNAPTFLTIS
jgi:hypothetical protein